MVMMVMMMVMMMMMLMMMLMTMMIIMIVSVLFQLALSRAVCVVSAGTQSCIICLYTEK